MNDCNIISAPAKNLTLACADPKIHMLVDCFGSQQDWDDWEEYKSQIEEYRALERDMDW